MVKKEVNIIKTRDFITSTKVIAMADRLVSLISCEKQKKKNPR